MIRSNHLWSRFSNLLREYHPREYHPIVWIILIGTIFTRIASSMSIPFLAIYLSAKGMPLTSVGFTVGLSALASTLGGFIGGNLSDRFGRGVVMVFTLFVWAGIFFGFAFAHAIWVFMVLNFLNGFCRSFFEPTSQALIADVTPQAKRVRVYSLRYFAINVGAVVGPLIGSKIALSSSPSSAFMVTGIAYLLYLGVLIFVFMRYLELYRSKTVAEKVTFNSALRIVYQDRALGFFILAGLLFSIGYSQLDSNLALYLMSPTLFSHLISLNAIVVVVCQLVVTRWAEKRSVLSNMVIGTLLGSVGLLLFGIGGHWLVFVAGMFILTIGEILIFPMSNVFVDQLAKKGMRGTYFGASKFQMLGSFIGPTLGGWMLGGMGGHWLFAILSIVVASGIIFYWLGLQAYEADQKSVRHARVTA